MANATETPDDDAMAAEYDFADGVRGKYAARFPSEVHMIVPDPDVAVRFPDAASVNEALRPLAAIADRSRGT